MKKRISFVIIVVIMICVGGLIYRPKVGIIFANNSSKISPHLKVFVNGIFLSEFDCYQQIIPIDHFEINMNLGNNAILVESTDPSAKWETNIFVYGSRSYIICVDGDGEDAVFSINKIGMF